MKGKEIEVIKLLIEYKGKDVSINNIATLLKKDYKNAHNIITRLSKAGLVNLDTFGKSYKVTLLTAPSPIIYEAECLRRKELLKNKNLAVMLSSFKNLSSNLYILLLFGSYAKKMQTKHSDIDLMFIVPDESEEKMEKEIQNIVDSLPLKIHLNIFKESDFKAMMNSKEITVGSEAINRNVILHGIESYYEIIR